VPLTRISPENSMDLHASATAAHVGPKRMLALLLDDDGNIIRISPKPLRPRNEICCCRNTQRTPPETVSGPIAAGAGFPCTMPK